MNSKKNVSFQANHPFSPFFYTAGGRIEANDITQKRILCEIARAVKYVPNGTQIKYKELLDITEEDFVWAFRNFKKDNPCTWKQEFQFKLLSGVVYTNKTYVTMKRKSSANCTFCDEKEQSFIHLFIECPQVVRLRDQLSKHWQGTAMDKKRWFLGVSDTCETLEKCKNIIAKELNHFIFKMNWAGTGISVTAFKNWLRSDEEPEEALSFRVNKVFDHNLKWSHIQLLLA